MSAKHEFGFHSENENLIFLSHTLGPDTPVYGNGKAVEFTTLKSLLSGDSCSQLDMHFNNHSGSHMDFPSHFVASGKTASDYRAQDFCFDSVNLVWLDAAEDELLGPKRLLEHLKGSGRDCELLLIRTGIGMKRGTEDFWKHGPGIDVGVAPWLREQFPRLRAIGLDSISLTGFQNRDVGRSAHREFLGGDRPLLILEDLNLEILNGKTPARVIALPLRIQSGDGAPCTAIASMN
jgi:arylformamidase